MSRKIWRLPPKSISQLLIRKKLPPASDRTDIYDKMGKFLKLPGDKVSKLADLPRMEREELKRTLGTRLRACSKKFEN